MEDIAPALKAIFELRCQIGSGQSVRGAIRHYISNSNDGFSRSLTTWWIQFEKTASGDTSLFSTRFQKSLVYLLHRGLRGEPIADGLHELQQEMKSEGQAQVDKHISQLPFICLLPLMGLQLPAFLILLLGPLLSQFLSSLETVS